MNIKELLKLAGVDITKGKAKQLVEGIEDRHSELMGRFDDLVQKHKNHADISSYQAQFKRGMKEFSAGYNADDDDVMHNGMEGMEQAVEALEKL